MKYLAQIMAVFNWMHERFWRRIFGNAANAMEKDGFYNYGERKDGDGTRELLIGTTMDDPFYAPIVFEMYTLSPEGSPVRVFTSQERARYYLCEDNTFLFEGANSAADSVTCYYSYAAGTLTEIPGTASQPQTLSYTPFSRLNA